LDGQVNIAMACDQNDRKGRVDIEAPAHQRQTVQTFHANIGDENTGKGTADIGKGRLTVGQARHVELGKLKALLHGRRKCSSSSTKRTVPRSFGGHS
jgi:hypothetical protein